jgi:hypothetical protein
MMSVWAGRPALARDWRRRPVEMAIGIGLVVIAAVLIVGIVRVVSSNLDIGG